MATTARATTTKKAAPKPPAKKAAAKKPAPKPAPKPKTYSDYGFVSSFLNAHKDVKAKVDEAIKNGWTPARLEGELKTTKWWRDRTESQRKWDLLDAEQPGQRNALIAAKKQEIVSAAAKMGVTITDQEATNFAMSSLRDGKSDQEITLGLASHFEIASDNPATPENEGVQTGMASSTVDALRKMAGDYGVTVRDQDLVKWTQQVIGGQTTVNDLEDSFRESAKALYPPLADILDKGQTVRGFVSPYLEIAATQLGMTPDMMDLRDSKWTAMIEGGNVLSADQWTQKIRTDARYGWGETQNAKREAMNVVSTLGKIFGGV